MLTITEAAQTKITDLLLEENNPAMRLRMYVQGGGCSGMSYGFTLDEVKNEDDFEILFRYPVYWLMQCQCNMLLDQKLTIKMTYLVVNL